MTVRCSRLVEWTARPSNGVRMGGAWTGVIKVRLDDL
jgi:hypothetical protein